MRCEALPDALQEGTLLRDGVLRLRKGYEWADPSDRKKGAVLKARRHVMTQLWSLGRFPSNYQVF